MKKCEFYTLVFEGGKYTAMKRKGYTDSKYNYYSNGSLWFGIIPENGLATCYLDTRKETVERTYSEFVQDRIKKYKETEKYKESKKIFEQAVKEAKELESKNDFYKGVKK